MAVKTLKMVFRKKNNINKSKTYFLELLVSLSNDRAPSFLIQPKLIWLAVLSSNDWLYDFNATRFQKILKFFLVIFVLLVPLEILSRYSDIDSSHWLREGVQWVIDKFFREKLMD